MPRTVGNESSTAAAEPAAETDSTPSAVASEWSAAGLTFSSGYESHSLYPVMYQVITIATESGGTTKRVFLRGAIRKNSDSTATDFEGEVLVMGLPATVRPPATRTFVTAVYDAGGGSSRRKELHLGVSETGQMLAWGSDLETISSALGSSLALDGISWDTSS